MRVAVVGAGVVGLASAYELSRHRDVELRCYEQAVPMGARSVGGTRVFRLGHRDPRLVRLALRAEHGWQRWGQEFGWPLIDRASTVLSGPPAWIWYDAMRQVGAPARLVEDPAALGLPAQSPPGPFLVDERGGVVDVRSTGDALRQRLGPSVRVGDQVQRLTLSAGGVRVDAVSGRWDCDAALLLAGAGTLTLAAQVGIDGVPSRTRHHHRFTFRLPDAEAGRPCWLDQSEAWRPGYTTYQHRTAAGRWAIGGSLDDAGNSEDITAEQAARRAREAVTGYVREQLGWPAAEIVDVVHCDSMGLGDGIGTGQNGAGQNGSVLALWGDNLMKFAPVLGELLARSALAGHVDEELLAVGPPT